MAINSHLSQCEKSSHNTQNTADRYKLRKLQGHGRAVVKIDYSAESSLISKTSKYKNNINLNSPYLDVNGLKMLTSLREKCLQKKNIMSSFPLAATVYKASSHEFKAAKVNKKVKKSVLTLPSTDNALLPQSCTVSDMNGEYNKDNIRKKSKKRTPSTRKAHRHVKQFYDRDAQYCNQFNIDLDCSSTDMLKDCNNSKCKYKASDRQSCAHEGCNPHDVWTVLRKINTFQFNPSPPMSSESFLSPKKKKIPKSRNNRKDNMRLVGACRTEEIAYISSIEIESKSRQSLSPASSFDKVTVIDRKENSKRNIYQDFNTRVVKPRDFVGTKGKQAYMSKLYDKNSALCVFGDSNISYGNRRMRDHLGGDSNLVSYQNILHPNTEDSKKEQFITDASLIIEDNKSIDDCNGSKSTRDEIIYSSYSGSSKRLSLCQDPTFKSKRDLNKKTARGNASHDTSDLSGITKVVLSKAPNTAQLQPTRPQLLKLNNRLTRISFNNPTIDPKLNQAHIQRQLRQLTYPIVILGKDQLTDKPFEIVSEEPPQFQGLDKEIWPFMVTWYKAEKDPHINLRKPPQSKESLGSQPPAYRNKIKKDEVESLSQNANASSGKQLKSIVPNVCKFNSRPKNELQQRCPLSSCPLRDIERKAPEKYKPLQEIRSKVLKLLNKSLTESSLIDNAVKRQNNFKKFVCETDKQNNVDSRKASAKPLIAQADIIRPWSKTKWKSEFIDNVMKKLGNGVYYTDNVNKVVEESGIIENEDARLISETSNAVDKTLQSISKVTIKKKCESLIAIPGFTNAMPALEIEMMKANEIAVRHCKMNIVLRFDVTLHGDSVSKLNNKAITFIPLELAESQTRIFKCDTSILNAMLPAELCSLLPKMMENLVDSREMPLPRPVDEVDSRLSAVHEVLRCESLIMFRITTISPQIGQLLNGRYWKTGKLCSTPTFENNVCKIEYDHQLVQQIAELVKPKQPLDYGVELTMKTLMPKMNRDTCTALVPYVEPNLRLDALNSLPQLDNFLNLNNITQHTVNLIINNNICINLTICYPYTHIVKVGTFNFTMNRINEDINGFNNFDFYTNKAVETPAIEYKYNVGNKRSPIYLCVKNHKSKVMRTKSFKNASKLTKEKRIALSKIKDIDDFLQVLGARHILSDVFDNNSKRKILTCISQMKNWTKVINSKQAFLVLLLTNKRETSNLQRYRTILLQGICVNRITKAHELDMEIEVIEREHLTRIPQYEGISYLPASAENQECLFEELCWIAKTTASDYKRPFDESSEELLRSLLEKRKKLNPSYLRVMARYVGLGLLKQQRKK